MLKFSPERRASLTLTCYYLLIILLRVLFSYGDNCLDYTAKVIGEWMSVQL